MVIMRNGVRSMIDTLMELDVRYTGSELLVFGDVLEAIRKRPSIIAYVMSHDSCIPKVKKDKFITLSNGVTVILRDIYKLTDLCSNFSFRMTHLMGDVIFYRNREGVWVDRNVTKVDNILADYFINNAQERLLEYARGSKELGLMVLNRIDSKHILDPRYKNRLIDIVIGTITHWLDETDFGGPERVKIKGSHRNLKEDKVKDTVEFYRPEIEALTNWGIPNPEFVTSMRRDLDQIHQQLFNV